MPSPCMTPYIVSALPLDKIAERHWSWQWLWTWCRRLVPTSGGLLILECPWTYSPKQTSRKEMELSTTSWSMEFWGLTKRRWNYIVDNATPTQDADPREQVRSFCDWRMRLKKTSIWEPWATRFGSHMVFDQQKIVAAVQSFRHMPLWVGTLITPCSFVLPEPQPLAQKVGAASGLPLRLAVSHMENLNSRTCFSWIFSGNTII